MTEIIEDVFPMETLNDLLGSAHDCIDGPMPMTNDIPSDNEEVGAALLSESQLDQEHLSSVPAPVGQRHQFFGICKPVGGAHLQSDIDGVLCHSFSLFALLPHDVQISISPGESRRSELILQQPPRAPSGLP